MTFTATYDPNDDKLRLYSALPVDADTHGRASEAGYRWMPESGALVATWTPEAEDFALELAGRIDDNELSSSEHDQCERGIESRNVWDSRLYWEQRARAVWRAGAQNEAPEVRYRRIKRLQSALRKHQRLCKEATEALRVWDVPHMSHSLAVALASLNTITLSVPDISDGKARLVSAYALLTAHGAAGRVKEITRKVIEHFRAAQARACRWIDHYSKRIAYERVIHGQAGGLPAERFDIRVGGRVLVGNEWLTVMRLNRAYGQLVSVTTSPPQDVCGRQSWVYSVELIRDYEPPAEPVQHAGEAGQYQHRPHQMTGARHGISRRRAATRLADLIQTPDALADEIVMLAELEPGHRVLDPSAGTGSLLRAARRAFGEELTYVAVETNWDMCNALERRIADTAHCADFLQLRQDTLGLFDRILIHPPLAQDADIAHVRHALNFLRPGGRMVGICYLGLRQEQILKPLAEASGGLWLPLAADRMPVEFQIPTVLFSINV